MTAGARALLPRLLAALALCALAPAGCVKQLPIASAPCPCGGMGSAYCCHDRQCVLRSTATCDLEDDAGVPALETHPDSSPADMASDETRLSCAGLGNVCGIMSDQDCCAANAIPGGYFLRSDDPASPAYVNAFSLDDFEISIGRFRKFVAAYSPTMIAPGSGKNPNDPNDQGWQAAFNDLLPKDAASLVDQVGCNPQTADQSWNTAPTNETDSLPMPCLEWHVAQAFCIWDGGRLPTEAEWNFAAAGGDEQRVFPWSRPPDDATIDSGHARWGCDPDSSCWTHGLARVGSSSPAGDGRWGQSDLAGSVRELVRDAFVDPYPSASSPCVNCAVQPGASAAWVVRGGGFATPKAAVQELTSSFRGTIAPNADPTAMVDVGARCARSLGTAPPVLNPDGGSSKPPYGGGIVHVVNAGTWTETIYPREKRRMLVRDQGDPHLVLLDLSRPTNPVVWKAPTQGLWARGVQLVGNDQVMGSRSDGYEVFNLIDGSPAKTVTTFPSTQSAYRMANGEIMLTQNVPATKTDPGRVTLSFLDGSDRISRTITYPKFGFVRMTRPTRNGTFLVPANNTVFEGDDSGKVLWSATSPDWSHIWEALLLEDGSTMVATFLGSSLDVLDPTAHTVTKRYGTKAVPMAATIMPNGFAEFQILPNKNIVTTNWPAQPGKGGQVIEFDPTGKVVWFYQPDATVISMAQGVLVLDGLDTKLPYAQEISPDGTWQPVIVP